MTKFYLISLIMFSCIRAIEVAVHFLGDSPYGGKLVVDPIRLVFNAILIELAVVVLITLIFAGLSNLSKRILKGKTKLPQRIIDYCYLLFIALYMTFAQLDLEIVRWMGEHLSLSFFNNYITGRTDTTMLGRLLDSDILYSSIATIFIIIGIVSAIILKKFIKSDQVFPRTTIAMIVLFFVLALSPLWLMPSLKRWKRIMPAAIDITYEYIREASGMEKAKNPKLAYADLISFINTGKLADAPLDSIPQYPFYDIDAKNQNNPNPLTMDEFRALPDSSKPNIIYLTFETWRGWKSHLSGDTTIPTFSPLLDSVIANEAYYFPFAHSHGYPSVEGTLGIHLGLWSHFRKIFINDYLSVNSVSLTEIFRNLGYKTEIYIGADPSFSNLSPWFKRWYEYFEYSKKYSNDGPLLERFSQALDTIDRAKPFFLSTWTVTCHPPYKIPASEGTPAADIEERYNQTLTYSDKHIVKLIDNIKANGLWEKSIFIIVGDHSQPNTEVRKNTELGGVYTQGHTWIPIAIMGGWKGLPKPKKNDMTVSQTDVAPTILDLINVKAPNNFLGKSLIPPPPIVSIDSLGDTTITEVPFEIRPRKILTFNRNHVSLISDNDRITFDIFSDNATYYQLDRKSVINYALLKGHNMKISNVVPYEFDIKRYRDMIFAYTELLDQNRIIPPNVYPKKPLGIYNYVE